jgi:hypothetical protein
MTAASQAAEKLAFGWRSAFSAAIKLFLFCAGLRGGWREFFSKLISLWE